MPNSHTVAEGECLSSIAFEYGLFPDALWAAPENAALRGQRKDPHVLQPGDVVVIPEKRPGHAACPTGKRHTFRRKGVPEKLRFTFESAGEPRGDEPYELRVDGKLLAGGARTDADGHIEHWISPGAREAVVRFVDTDEECVFALGALDPVDSLAGAQARLKSLGFFAGAIDGAPTDALPIAVATYQASRGIDPTGELDDATRSRLLEDHGA
jgi:hypothetical protein